VTDRISHDVHGSTVPPDSRERSDDVEDPPGRGCLPPLIRMLQSPIVQPTCVCIDHQRRTIEGVGRIHGQHGCIGTDREPQDAAVTIGARREYGPQSEPPTLRGAGIFLVASPDGQGHLI
jgi:hypothetical protein